MNDQRLDALLGAYYRDTALTPREPHQRVGEVMRRVRRTRQRGRWWPLPTFDRPAVTYPSRELIPVPIPATNGRKPARGFTMFSALKLMVAGATVALFGSFLLSGILTTPHEDVVLPAAVTDPPADTDVVSRLTVGTGVIVTQDCAIEADPVTCDWTASDPRLTGRMVHDWVGEVFDADEPSVAWALATLEGPEGDWAGHVYAVWTDPGQLFVMLSGDGAYDGWQYVASTIDSEVSPGDSEWVGMLYEGELPPVGA